jgi:CubicO group peptidase (beta-lactamase class C family)
VGNVHWGRTGKHYVASVNKSITSAVVGLALAQSGRAVSTPLIQLLPQHQAQLTGAKAAITVEHALTMSMGFQWDEWSGRDLIDMWATPDIGAYAVAKPMAANPGAQWTYNSAGPNLLLAALQNALGKDIRQFARDSLFGPLGIEDYRWGPQPNGLPEGSARMFMRPRDMAKIGWLFRGGGMWQGRRILPASWTAAATRMQRSATPKSPHDYGYLWWVRKLNTAKGTLVNYYQADGDGGQYITLFPDQDLMVVATGGNYGDYNTYESQMIRILANHVLAGLNL